MKVVEIFESIQGEGRFMGKWITFVRFSGCNLQCSFCDEKSKYDNAKEMSIEDIVTRVFTHHVVLTGGEPTIQPDLDELCAALHKAGHYISIETNGTNPVSRESIDWITVSPKGPDYVINTPYDEVKFVVTEDLSYEKILETMEAARYRNMDATIWLQPCDGPYIEESKKHIMELCKGRTLRAGIQLHKYYGAI